VHGLLLLLLLLMLLLLRSNQASSHELLVMCVRGGGSSYCGRIAIASSNTCRVHSTYGWPCSHESAQARQAGSRAVRAGAEVGDGCRSSGCRRRRCCE